MWCLHINKQTNKYNIYIYTHVTSVAHVCATSTLIGRGTRDCHIRLTGRQLCVTSARYRQGAVHRIASAALFCEYLPNLCKTTVWFAVTRAVPVSVTCRSTQNTNTPAKNKPKRSKYNYSRYSVGIWAPEVCTILSGPPSSNQGVLPYGLPDNGAPQDGPSKWTKTQGFCGSGLRVSMSAKFVRMHMHNTSNLCINSMECGHCLLFIHCHTLDKNRNTHTY